MAIRLLEKKGANNLYIVYMGAAKFERVGHFIPDQNFDISRLGTFVETEEQALSNFDIKKEEENG